MIVSQTEVSESSRRAIEKFDQALFDRIADKYALKDVVASTRICRSAILRRAVRPIVEQHDSLGDVVDVGCGVGAQAVYLNGMFKTYVGVDYSASLIEIGRDIIADIPNASLVISNIKDVPIEDDSADTIIVVGAFHHMTDIPQVMQSLQRIARPEAKLVAIEPQRANPVVQCLRAVRMRIDSNYSSDQMFFTREEVVEFLEAAGMQDIQIEYQGFLRPPLAQVILNPQWLFAPVARAISTLEPVAERVLPGPASWNLVAYATFP